MVLKRLGRFLEARRGMKDFLALPQRRRKIVFYAEDAHSMMHFEEIIFRLIERHGEQVCYLTSDARDPVFHNPPAGLMPFYIGDGTIRTLLFLQMPADLLIMTMPDLEVHHIKRSKVYPVHYLYLFHAMVSTHSNYRKGAFDHYDTIFCTSPYQIYEVRATEKAYGLPPKRLVKVGYRRLEALMEDVARYRQTHGGPPDSGSKTVIVAPSWGSNAILETCGAEVVERLLEAGYRTLVRPHPMTVLRSPRTINVIRERFASHPLFLLQTDIRDKEALYTAHLLISDWSGVAMEYAFACERPVIFIDVPKKCNNPEANRIPQIPIEVSIRERIGRVVSPDALETLPTTIESLYSDAAQFISRIRQARNECVFHLGESVEIGAQHIKEMADERWKKNHSGEDPRREGSAGT